MTYKKPEPIGVYEKLWDEATRLSELQNAKKAKEVSNAIKRIIRNALGLETDILGTDYVSSIVGMSRKTVADWIDSGMLKGFTIPGSKFRRVMRSDLIEFMKKHGLPLINQETGESLDS